MNLGPVSGGAGARQPELSKCMGPVFRILRAELGRGLGGFLVASSSGQRSRQENLRASIAGIALQGFVEKLDRDLGSPEQQFGKPPEKQQNTLPSIPLIEAHGPLHRRYRFGGAPKEGRIVAV